MKKIFLSICIALATVLVPIQTASASTRVSVKMCVSPNVYNHLHSTKARKCKRHGFYYEKGFYPASTEYSPWVMIPYLLVYGPNGRIWVDTAGFYTSNAYVR